MKTHVGWEREVFLWVRWRTTGVERTEEMVALSFTTVAEMMTLFTCHSTGQSVSPPPYHGLHGVGE